MGKWVRQGAGGRYRFLMSLDFTTTRPWVRDILISAVAGAFVGLIGPFGSYLNAGLAIRISFFAALFALGTLIYRSGLLLYRRAQPQRPWMRALSFALMILAAAIPMALLSRIAALGIWPTATRAITPLTWYFQVVVLSLPLCVIYEILLRRQSTPLVVKAADLPLAFGPEVICLQMEDHYVRAHTSVGSALHLMTLSDAIARTANPGASVHRSWWVARHAVAGVVRDGRNLRLKLLNGLEVPVARRSVAMLKAQGLIKE